jgi:hypothetical protein
LNIGSAFALCQQLGGFLEEDTLCGESPRSIAVFVWGVKAFVGNTLGGANRDAARQRGICPAIPYRYNTKDTSGSNTSWKRRIGRGVSSMVRCDLATEFHR